MVMGELTEKLQTVIEHQILPQLEQTHLLPEYQSESMQPRCTFILTGKHTNQLFFIVCGSNIK